MKKIKLGIIDDHPAIGYGLVSELGKHREYKVLFSVSEKKVILKQLSVTLPDVLIMDILMPDTTGIEAFKEVLREFPDLRIIAYTSLNSPLIVELLLKAGVKGYLNKNHSFDELKEAISEVYNDEIYLPEDYKFILKKFRTDPLSVELSKREIEVLTLIAQEKKTSEIASLLNISVNTVETHRKNLFQKLNVTNLAGLIKCAIHLGYVK
jgi:DNA-binding NarL/FixJ family response regulator